MYKILKKEELGQDTFLMEIFAPRVAQSALPGQFMIIKVAEKSERIPLTISDSDAEKGTVCLVVKAIGHSTQELVNFQVGDEFNDVVGPLGRPSEFVHTPIEQLKKMNFAFIAGGVGIAPIYPLVKWMHDHVIAADVIIGARTKDLLFFLDKLKAVADNLYIATDDNSYGVKGLVTDVLKNLVTVEHKHYDEVTAIGPMIMMKFVAKTAHELGIKCIVSLNSLMVDGTGMCGACRVNIGGKTKFTCVDGPEFDASLVNFEECMKRQAMYNTVEGKKQMEQEEKEEGHECHIGGIAEEQRDRKKRVPVREQDPLVRSHNFDEVCYGYNAEEAVEEAQRCLNCKVPQCVMGCPVSIKIPTFIAHVAKGEFEEAAKVINEDSALPAICGRVCPQESQCEGKCILGKKGDPIAIGKLERFVGDWTREHQISFDNEVTKNGHKVAVIGSGPSGITCAKELLMKGYDVTVFEVLHEYGGVLVYGIPSFRLPKETVVKYEIENVRKLGAKFEKNVVVGRSVTVDDLLDKEGFDAVFLGTGAGFPNFMNIPGENLCGVVSANEFLTRNNLLFAYKEGYETPNYIGQKVAVVGGGNVAMDAARTAKRLGADVTIVYRRSLEELPARKEEVHHAEEEGIKFNLLTNPVEVIGNENGWVKGMKCIKMELGEPDASGRRSPVEIPNSEFVMDIDMMIMSIGTSPNPLISNTTHDLDVNRKGCIVVDEKGATSRKGIFAGGDAASGAATVILAMGAGKKAAAAIDAYIQDKK
ncbi:MAG: bifunctional dihydroorotate dehydrogenase B NAD binding subunit/NADPH-dependent glutamate synthase [Bacteroidales bacterium]|nr:bifunctional dihydroorotate dehydrogenase B NAD binding subunit/NADPH-dependent glutamate synthase [Bacteroidales bacterium]